MDKKVILPPARNSHIEREAKVKDSLNRLAPAIVCVPFLRNKIYMIRILWTIYKIWTKYPEQRFGQLIKNAILLNEHKADIFYIQDVDVKNSLNKMPENLIKLNDRSK